MPERDERRAWVGPGALLPLLLQLFATGALGAPAGRLVPAETGGSNAEWALGQARQIAEEKLADPSCRKVFADFSDPEGVLLEDKLLALGLDGPTYLRKRVLFYSGSGRSACATRETMAFTSPGSSVVFVCTAQFVEKTHKDPGLAAAILIHEELHSLGLTENPPSSKEITARVIERCGK